MHTQDGVTAKGQKINQRVVKRNSTLIYLIYNIQHSKKKKGRTEDPIPIRVCVCEDMIQLTHTGRQSV